MKFSNTTKYSDQFLRRLTAWCRAEIGLSLKHLRTVEFRNSSHQYGVNGRAWWSGRILTRIGPDADVARIVNVTAHEIQHIKQYRTGLHAPLVADRDMEPHTRRIAAAVENRFLARADALLFAWTVATPVKPLIDRRAEKAASDLARWERKLKLAKTKVAKYKARVTYYAKKAGGA